MPMTPIIDRAKSKGKEIFNYYINVTDLPTKEDLNQLKAIEDIIMVGYPNGLWDEHNNLPIFRKGITGTHPNVDYEGKAEFLIDCACFPGSSGSPVVILNEGMFTSRTGLIEGNILFFLVILYAGPIYAAEGEITIKSIPANEVTSITGIPINLGCVIKSYKIMDFESDLTEILKK